MLVPTVFWIAIYVIIWWLVLFLVLPFGVRTQGESGEIVPGTSAGAPVAPHMLRTLILTTIIAGLFFSLVYAVLLQPQLRAMVGHLFGYG